MKCGALLTLYLVERSQAEPDYFHEGEYDLAKDSLLEDLGAVNGVKQNDNMELIFKRATPA